ncbi:exopolysaccharide biosynthesis protein [Desulfohalotomaculum tongense]|uniref:phosphodiester glycosidase family protein n=1 Tax=Desulforadius tongensis TaxID=1216062 RepID=UPI001958F082|nr:phosphodiester glycosidase family protein [Desulforadius tongensis]MBM7854051.1 exopolysaccharide biosynthesis protein [Desulforadius tongensis]
MRLINIFFVFLTAPFIGIGIALAGFAENSQALGIPLTEVNAAVSNAEDAFTELQKNVTFLREAVEEQERQYKEQEKILRQLASKSQEHKSMSDQIYEERILAMLGPPIRTHRSHRVEVKVFKLDELGYRGYIAKVKLFDPSVFKVVLAKDKFGESETTSEAVARTGAILGINGGGFYRLVQNGKHYTLPIANTVIDGKLRNGGNGFQPSYEDIFIAGIQRNGSVTGAVVHTKEELMKLNLWQGVSFVPILIQDGKPLPLPKKWQHEKQPRTIIGEYANGDLIMIVVDGRQADWSTGVTLERLQIKLIELGVKEAYNLDGGGSSVFIYNGEVLNRPSDGKQRKVATNIVVLP